MNENMEINAVIHPQPNNSTPEDNGGQAVKMFTQDEVNKIISERLARERAKAAETPIVDERELALQKREQALEAREARYRCQDYLKEVGMIEKYHADFLETLDTSNFDQFKAVVDRLGKPYVATVRKLGAHVPHPPARTDGDTNDAAVASAFKPKF